MNQLLKSSMTDRRKFLKTTGAGLCTFTIGTSFSQSIQTNDREPFILRDLPDQYAEGYSNIRIGMCQVYTEEWKIEDPAGKPIAKFREIRNEIRTKIEKLVESLKKADKQSSPTI